MAGLLTKEGNHIKKTRMHKAIQGQQPDRIPRGELLIEQDFIKKFPLEPLLNDFQQKKKVLRELSMDFVTLTPGLFKTPCQEGETYYDPWGSMIQFTQGSWLVKKPAITGGEEMANYQFPDPAIFQWDELGQWVKDDEFFVFALLDGVFQGLGRLMDFNQFMMATITHQRETRQLAEKYGEFLCALAQRAIATGAHGLIIGDDMASSKGPLIAPDILQKIFFPIYRRVLEDLPVPVILHCCGNVDFILPHLAEMGFAGIHSLEPRAGMDLARVKQNYGQELCLMGNIDPGLLTHGDEDEVKKVVAETLAIGGTEGRFILGTASGCLTGSMGLANVQAMYLTE